MKEERFKKKEKKKEEGFVQSSGGVWSVLGGRHTVLAILISQDKNKNNKQKQKQ